MSQLKVSVAASLLGVSDDTIRRWIDRGRLTAAPDESGRLLVDGLSLAQLAREDEANRRLAALDEGASRRSARNHMTGLVTNVISDTVMSQVEMQCGPLRVVSLISTEAVHELGITPGSIATAVVKATNVTIEGVDGSSA